MHHAIARPRDVGFGGPRRRRAERSHEPRRRLTRARRGEQRESRTARSRCRGTAFGVPGCRPGTVPGRESAVSEKSSESAAVPRGAGDWRREAESLHAALGGAAGPDAVRAALGRFAAALRGADGSLESARLACYELLREASGEPPRRIDWELLETLGHASEPSELARRFTDLLERRALAQPVPRGPEELVRRARTLIERRADTPLSLSAVARCLGVSPGYLSSTFSRRVGMTVTQYIHRARLRRAEGLLRRSDLSLAEIARRCGFRTYRHFHRTFVRLRGCAPQTYRRSLAERREGAAAAGGRGDG
ncbi:MAG: AraC family transcriptional regulator [Acidobacteria bacterium]|nr:MAG: AraC family transcriptional regulator [Acidobacteriota bacterium]